MLKTGQKAPEFELADDQGESFRLRDHAGKWLLLVFYPGDDTPVCTRQLCEYRDGIEEFEGLGVEVVGISGDDAESHRKFKQKRSLPFRLLSDPDLSVAGKYGCRGMMGMKRGVFLLDTDQVCRYAHIESVALFRRSREELVEAIRAAQ
ncbi:MAG TPA: peroxiredoxin [Wenzhouxiangellaceae bacterium]|nr:peroxiredoxin [Wenzhouxiangellaceae bacterium]